ncbi:MULTISPECIES: hypothetical protein [unclassified Sphingomonas]|uniref:hypothetical protein n=1 Tax=unclassified Sphingomonas TaxID=196159 RepID=UPI0014051083|nr:MULTISPECIES: hypothetical protein [unclassified Sphingomonas]
MDTGGQAPLAEKGEQIGDVEYHRSWGQVAGIVRYPVVRFYVQNVEHGRPQGRLDIVAIREKAHEFGNGLQGIAVALQGRDEIACGIGRLAPCFRQMAQPEERFRVVRPEARRFFIGARGQVDLAGLFFHMAQLHPDMLQMGFARQGLTIGHRRVPPRLMFAGGISSANMTGCRSMYPDTGRPRTERQLRGYADPPPFD